jgi:hypothetical protein
LAGRAHALHALEPVEDFYALSQERRLPSWRRPADVTRIAEDQLRNDMMAVPANVTVMVEEGKPIDVILRAAKALGCDLIVTGIARDETLGRFGLGTTVDLLLRRSKVPGADREAKSPFALQAYRRRHSTFRNPRCMRFKPQHDFFRIRSSAPFMRMRRRSQGSHRTPRVTRTARSLPANSRRSWQRSICLTAASADRNSWSSAENRIC